MERREEDLYIEHLETLDSTLFDQSQELRIQNNTEWRHIKDARWIDLHKVLRTTPAMKEAIRDHKLVWKRGKKGADYSLEALELEFGIERPVAIRSRGHDYADGDTGEMAPLVYEQLEYRRKATQRQKADLELYCRYDVQSLYKISRECTRA